MIPLLSGISSLSNALLRTPSIRWFALFGTTALAGTGLATYYLGAIHPAQLVLVCTPVFQLGFLITAFLIFRSHMGREPRSVILNFEKGLAVDRAYSMIVFVTFAPPMFLYEYFGGLEQANGI